MSRSLRQSRVASRSPRALSLAVSLGLLATLGAGLLSAVEVPERVGLREKEFRLPDLDLETAYRLPAELPRGDGALLAAADLAALGLPADGGRLDARSGRWATLTPAQPLVPGSGVGNELTWEGLGRPAPASERELGAAVAAAFRDYVGGNAVHLRIDVGELAGYGFATVHEGGAVAQIYVTRAFHGVPVRGSHLNAVVNHGNLVLFGANAWGDIDVSTTPQISAEVAMWAVQAHAEPFAVIDVWRRPDLILVPTARGKNVDAIRLGQGYGHRLAWVLRPSFADELGTWEALVDAHSGELLAFEDTNRYAEVKGGVYPKTNDGVGQDGTEQPGWPMPFQDTTLGTTDTGGNVAGSGSMTATFFGPYVNMADNCGTDSLTQIDGIDWGTSGGTDCVTPGFGGPGNTHASRSGFYELNRIKEMARSHLPSNTWLQGRLTANMNINNTCNAFWNGSTVNFYRSGGGCANTGEIAAVFDHEWGHGMDANDAVGGIASPSGEGIADVYSALRLYDSCIGRNFLPTNCSGNGDPCLNCTGVRDIDYLQRQSGQPHDYSWSNANCGGSVHCIGGVYSEAVWSLWKRKLPTLYGVDNNTAAEIVTRLTYIGAGATSTWFSGGPPNGGCGGSSGYMNYLAADDDDGNLNNGTPHMTAIYQAFNDQEIACQTPTVQDSGCAGVPASAPNVTATSGDTSVGLSWGAVSGASSYDVFRAEGIFQCDFGKVKIGSTAGTSLNDTSLQNGRDYSYVVIPKSGASCFGPASTCDTVQPGAVACTQDSDCDDALFCNGAETCVANVCTAGTDPCAANPTWTCDEDADVCVPECTVDGDCDDGLFCTGVETCDAGTCAAGSDPCPGQSCDEGGDICTDTNGPQIAVYDAGLGAPACAIRGSSCDSTTLLNSRDNLSPSEPNQPNTLTACADGTSGIYHSDESNDRIVVSTLDAQDFSEGAAVEVEATVWAWTGYTSDTLDLYYAADANSPSWTHIASIVPPGSGVQTLTAQYVLPAGTLQAVRANFRYAGSQSSCSGGTYDDADDLVFAVGGAAPACTVDADCDDGLYCNGDETCNTGTGQCEDGTAPVCDDGAFCNGTETCNETTDSCDPGTPPACDDGLFCNGTETCNETTDQCDAGTPPACDDGVFCNGSETCNEGTDGCDPGTPPSCDDGVGCTDDSCNVGTDSCDNVANDALCPDDGAYCTGTEFCDPTLDCQSTGNPCGPGETCDEGGDVCVPPGVNPVIWMSFRSTTSVPGVGTVQDEDIVSFDEGSRLWQFRFDGSDVGLGGLEIDGLAVLPGGDLLLSFTAAGTVGGMAVDDSDIVRFTPTSMGPSTAGSFSFYFDGSDVGLTNSGEDVDGIALAADGRLIVSTTGGFSGNGASGADEDLFLFTGTLGPTTSGSFVQFFDGSDVGLGGVSAEDVDAATLTAGGNLLFSTLGSFVVTGLSGNDEDVVEFAGTFGSSTSGTFSMRLDLTTLGIISSEDVGSLHVVE